MRQWMYNKVAPPKGFLEKSKTGETDFGWQFFNYKVLLHLLEKVYLHAESQYAIERDTGDYSGGE